jgi:hypothetical protein
MLDQMFRVILEFAADSGITAERTTRVFAQARRDVAHSPYRLSDALHFKVMMSIAEVFKAWYTEPEYLDSHGAPVPLPLSGAKSVEHLISHYVPKVNARDTARWLIAEGILRQQGRGRLVPTRRMISFAQANAMMVDRIPFLLQGLLSTFSHNIEANAKGGETRCERMLTLDRFRVRDLPRFDREVKRLVPMLLDQLELWAAPFLEPEGSLSQRTARVGLEAFSYVEEPAPGPKRGRRL